MINLPEQDWYQLSAYLDRELSQADQARLERRLAVEPELMTGLSELRQLWFALHSQPRLRAPRNYYLTPAMVGLRQARPGTSQPGYPIFRLVSAIAAILLVVVVAGDLLAGSPVSRLSQPEAAVQEMAMPVGVVETSEVLEAPASEAAFEAAPLEPAAQPTMPLPAEAPAAEPPAEMLDKQVQPTTYPEPVPVEKALSATQPEGIAPEDRAAEATATAVFTLEAAMSETGLVPDLLAEPEEIQSPGWQAAAFAIRDRIAETITARLQWVRVLEVSLAVLAITAWLASFFLKKRR